VQQRDEIEACSARATKASGGLTIIVGNFGVACSGLVALLTAAIFHTVVAYVVLWSSAGVVFKLVAIFGKKFRIRRGITMN